MVRCSSLAEHVWPSFYLAECQVKECPHVEFAELAIDFLIAHPRVRDDPAGVLAVAPLAPPQTK